LAASVDPTEACRIAVGSHQGEKADRKIGPQAFFVPSTSA
jgi:hypothetical protein